jgi:hypothetical protein
MRFKESRTFNLWLSFLWNGLQFWKDFSWP